ncbi:MAG TPA: ATP-binding protein [Chloroflexota bacterium]|nr:ATP-binding protein [Chloroflexota bacterium]
MDGEREILPAPARPPDSLPAALTAATARLVSEPSDEAVGQVLVEEAARLVGAPDVRLALLNGEAAWWVLGHAIGPAAGRQGERQPLPAGILGYIIQSGQLLEVADLARHPLASAEHGGPACGSVIGVPLRLRGELLGAIMAARPTSTTAFGTDELSALQVLADVAAARLGAEPRGQNLRARAQDLAGLNPVWRPPPELAGDFVIVTTGRDQPFLDLDEAACRILGYPRDALLQCSMPDIIPLPPGGEKVDTLAGVRDQMVRGIPISFDTIARRRDGSLFPIRLMIQRVTDATPPIYRCIFSDLSHEKNAQLQAIQKEKQRLLQEIGSSLAHEMNSPLAVILGNLEMILEEFRDDDLQTMLRPVHNAAERISSAVHELQRFAKPILARGWASVDISELAGDAIEKTRGLWDATSGYKGPPIEVRLQASPVARVRGNPIELTAAIRELIANAVQALPNGGVITISTAQVDEGVLLSVSDSGVGMRDATLQRCLDPFFTTRRPLATGLGLSRVHHTVLQHQGQLRITSGEGTGTQVTIVLPFTLQEDADA